MNKISQPKSKTRLERGATMVEMGLLIALIAVICVVVVKRNGRVTACKMLAIDAGLKYTGTGPPNYSYTFPGGTVMPLMPSPEFLINNVYTACASADDATFYNYFGL
jgi:hypothetical protein